MNSYLLESEDSLSLQTERDNIIQENHFEDAVINTYDMEEVPLENALEDLDTYGFLSDKKVIVIENIEVLMPPTLYEQKRIADCFHSEKQQTI